MGLFDKLGKAFEKKNCDICGSEIKLLGNRKMEDGNLCKECASKLSPWFSERRHSTVAEIREQLAYREENKKKVEEFNVTRSIGKYYMVYLDEDARRFLVSSSKNFRDSNPDVLDFSQVTGCDLDIDESKTEEKRKDKDGNMVSYNPPRYSYSYNFYIDLRVNHPWFDEMRFRLNSSSVDIEPSARTGAAGSLTSAILNAAMNAMDSNAMNAEYKQYVEMGREIKNTLLQIRQDERDSAAAANAPKTAVTCPHCGASTIPDGNGCCEYCGGAVTV